MAYLEITAINPNATAQKLSVNKRWFDLDDDGLQASIAQQPILIATHAAHRARAAERGGQTLLTCSEGHCQQFLLNNLLAYCDF